MSSPLASLVCGNHGPHGALGTALQTIADMLDNAVDVLTSLKPFDQFRKRLTATYYSRAILETANTALIARLDPLRILSLMAIQSDQGYVPGARCEAAIQWAGDIIPPKVAAPLSMNTKPADLVRTLFGNHVQIIFWEPAFQLLVDDPDFQSASSGSSWLTDLAAISSNNFIARVMDSEKKLYSFLSKGIHHEFVSNRLLQSIFDEATVSEKVSETLRYSSWLALVSHKFIPGIASLTMSDAIRYFRQIEDLRL